VAFWISGPIAGVPEAPAAVLVLASLDDELLFVLLVASAATAPMTISAITMPMASGHGDRFARGAGVSTGGPAGGGIDHGGIAVEGVGVAGPQSDAPSCSPGGVQAWGSGSFGASGCSSGGYHLPSDASHQPGPAW
jgi:hypothetical protein